MINHLRTVANALNSAAWQLHGTTLECSDRRYSLWADAKKLDLATDTELYLFDVAHREYLEQEAATDAAHYEYHLGHPGGLDDGSDDISF